MNSIKKDMNARCFWVGVKDRLGFAEMLACFWARCVSRAVDSAYLTQPASCLSFST